MDRRSYRRGAVTVFLRRFRPPAGERRRANAVEKRRSWPVQRRVIYSTRIIVLWRAFESPTKRMRSAGVKHRSEDVFNRPSEVITFFYCVMDLARASFLPRAHNLMTRRYIFTCYHHNIIVKRKFFGTTWGEYFLLFIYFFLFSTGFTSACVVPVQITPPGSAVYNNNIMIMTIYIYIRSLAR